MRPVQSASAPACGTGRRAGHDPDRIDHPVAAIASASGSPSHTTSGPFPLEARAVDEILR